MADLDEAGPHESDDDGDHVDGELELQELGDAVETLRPHITALTIDVKLSSVRMMSDASFATSVPAIPCSGRTNT